MIKNTKLYSFIQNRMIKANRNANKYLDTRSGLDEEERHKEYKKYTQEEMFWDKILLRVYKEEFVFPETKTKAIKTIKDFFKGNFRPDLTGKDFDTLTII